ncbi:hypothetical protein [Sanguibacter sp. 25GB23B1]|uniref:hypothetical protein n=1 Tax=unclassified Sanguibacter TaxID=2645534 RepID=UPI0032AEC6DB
MTFTHDLSGFSGLAATLTLAEQDVADAAAALSSAALVDWASTSATLYQEALTAAALQLTIIDLALSNARASLVAADA